MPKNEGPCLSELQAEELLDALVSSAHHATNLLKEYREHRDIEKLTCGYRMLGHARSQVRIVVSKRLGLDNSKVLTVEGDDA